MCLHATRPSYPFRPGFVTQIIFSEALHCVSLWISKQHFVEHVYVAAVSCCAVYKTWVSALNVTELVIVI